MGDWCQDRISSEYTLYECYIIGIQTIEILGRSNNKISENPDRQIELCFRAIDFDEVWYLLRICWQMMSETILVVGTLILRTS